jgi:hypothetical protein
LVVGYAPARGQKIVPAEATSGVKITDPGKNTGVILIKVFLTIKPYPMKNQKYVESVEFRDLICRLLFLYSIPLRKRLINYLKIWVRCLRRPYFLAFLAPCPAAAVCCCASFSSCSWLRISGCLIGRSVITSGKIRIIFVTEL